MNEKNIPWIALIISFFSLIVSGISAYTSKDSSRTLSSSLKETQQKNVDSDILQLQNTWQTGTFQCIDYLASLEDTQKRLAYTIRAHNAPRNSIETLISCVPQHEEMIRSLLKSTEQNQINIPTYITSDVNHKVRISLNSLNFLASHIKDVDDKLQCKIWDEVDDPIKQSAEKNAVTDWRKNADCGLGCFPAIYDIINTGRITVLNNKCD